MRRQLIFERELLDLLKILNSLNLVNIGHIEVKNTDNKDLCAYYDIAIGDSV